MTIETAIETLENDLKRLKVQYDMFFCGAAPKQPFELRRQVEQTIRTFSHASIRKYSDRFRFNTLVGRFNAMSELWNKHLRLMEEGRPAPGAAPPARLPSPPAPRPREDSPVLYQVVVTNPEQEHETMRLLYERYVSAKGEDAAGRIKLESFIKQVAKQASNLRESKGATTIEFRVMRTQDGVSLRARAADKE